MLIFLLFNLFFKINIYSSSLNSEDMCIPIWWKDKIKIWNYGQKIKGLIKQLPKTQWEWKEVSWITVNQVRKEKIIVSMNWGMSRKMEEEKWRGILQRHGLGERFWVTFFLKNSDPIGHRVEISLEVWIKCKFMKLWIIFGLPL